MIQDLVQTADVISILLVLALITALVVAFKVMEMIFDTALIAGISGVFYIGLRTIQGGQITVNDLLLFTFLGASVYMFYSFLASLYRVGTTVIPIPYHIIQTVLKPFRYGWDKLKEAVENSDDYAPKKPRSSEKSKDKDGEDEEDKKDKTTKEVVLGNQKEKDEE